jgi:hypothetical protein
VTSAASREVVAVGRGTDARGCAGTALPVRDDGGGGSKDRDDGSSSFGVDGIGRVDSRAAEIDGDTSDAGAVVSADGAPGTEESLGDGVTGGVTSCDGTGDADVRGEDTASGLDAGVRDEDTASGLDAGVRDEDTASGLDAGAGDAVVDAGVSCIASTRCTRSISPAPVDSGAWARAEAREVLGLSTFEGNELGSEVPSLDGSDAGSPCSVETGAPAWRSSISSSIFFTAGGRSESSSSGTIGVLMRPRERRRWSGGASVRSGTRDDAGAWTNA